MSTQVQVRQTSVQTRTKLISQIGAKLLRLGYRVGTGAAEHFALRVSRLELPQELSSLLEPLNERIAQLDQALAERAKADPRPRGCSNFRAWDRPSR